MICLGIISVSGLLHCKRQKQKNTGLRSCEWKIFYRFCILCILSDQSTYRVIVMWAEPWFCRPSRSVIEVEEAIFVTLVSGMVASTTLLLTSVTTLLACMMFEANVRFFWWPLNIFSCSVQFNIYSFIQISPSVYDMQALSKIFLIFSIQVKIYNPLSHIDHNNLLIV